LAVSEARTVKAFKAGTHRLIPPEQTVERMRPFMARMGITRVANVTGLDCIGIPVVMVVRPNGRAVSVSQGKGLTLDAARASGLMESVEAYQGERVTLPLRHGSFAELRDSFPLVDVTQLPRKANGLFHYDRPLYWIEGYDLLQGESIWVPYELVHVNFTFSPGNESSNFAASSNGLASGNHLLEAISHALCEVVERDSTALWKVAGEEGRRRRRVNLDTVDDPACREAVFSSSSSRSIPRVRIWTSRTVPRPRKPASAFASDGQSVNPG
jgi:YcaO-like protein with predicted kinase domain